MIKRELGIFIMVGLLTVCIDLSIYRSLLHSGLLGLDGVNLAKVIGFIGGTIFAYFANRFLTFKHRVINAGSIGRFILAYFFSLASNISVNHISISWLNSLALLPELNLSIAFILATFFSALVNFISMKFFVFLGDSRTA